MTAIHVDPRSRSDSIRPAAVGRAGNGVVAAEDFFDRNRSRCGDRTRAARRRFLLTLLGGLGFGPGFAGLGMAQDTAAPETAQAPENGDSASSPDATDSSPADRFWVAPPPRTATSWFPRPVEMSVGRIREFDAERFVWTRPDGTSERRISARRVVWVRRAAPSAFERAGVRAFWAGRYADALPALLDAVGTRPPVWHQQWLSMVAAQAAWRAGRGDVALELISQIDRIPMTPLALAWLPVRWHGEEQDRAARDAAASGLASPSPAVRLVAASWLVNHRRGSSSQVLRSLSRDDSHPGVAALAVHAFRRSATPAEVSASGERWRDEVRGLPIVWQVGPTKMLIDRFEVAEMRPEAGRLRRLLELVPPHPHPDLPG